MVARLKLGLDNRISRRSSVILTVNSMLLQGTTSTYGQGCSLCDTNGSDIDLQRVREREPAEQMPHIQQLKIVALGDRESITGKLINWQGQASRISSG